MLTKYRKIDPFDSFDDTVNRTLNNFGFVFERLEPNTLEFQDGKATLELDAPGVKKEDVLISIEKDVLYINWVRNKQKYTYNRTLAVNVDEAKSTATLKDGVLTVTLYEIPRQQRTIRVD